MGIIMSFHLQIAVETLGYDKLFQAEVMLWLRASNVLFVIIFVHKHCVTLVHKHCVTLVCLK